MTNSRPSLKQIKSAANVYFGFDVTVKTRKREVVRARQVAQYVAHIQFGYSQKDTGMEIGSKDHSSVYHGKEVIINEMALYEDTRTNVRQLYALCKVKENPESPIAMVRSLLTSKTIDIHVKVELRKILKRLIDESN
jgi:hypothetical protein